ncbi:expressed unknown protein [Seminavis robusta]|uniref:ADF-H domain-containing protein n=1 Tax=Seminavis robusta TaxID=568900 RepID=A0A9N8DQT8_9STRA|nr:expressed unknown protein [Seminavis robusta]|eukprot:Sro216_g089470.1 n/a (149) ;mRNA; f:63598-64285
MSNVPIIAGTLQTDPRSGGQTKKSGVNPLPDISETWEKIRDNNNNEVDWLIAGYIGGSKTDIGVIKKGTGGLEAAAKELPDGEPIFGGCRLNKKGRFVKFYYCSENTSGMKKGRAAMHKNGVLNVMEGCDGEVKILPDMTEDDIEKIY